MEIDLVSGIMAYAGATREEAEDAATAIEEASAAFNAAKKIDAEEVTISRRTLYVLTTLATQLLGMTNLADSDGDPEVR